MVMSHTAYTIRADNLSCEYLLDLFRVNINPEVAALASYPGFLQTHKPLCSNPSFPAVLRPNDLFAVLTELREVIADWYIIGLALEFPPAALDAMKDTHTEPMDCMIDMVKKWLNTSEPSWKGLIAALRQPLVGKLALAGKLEDKYCTQATPQGKIGENCKPQ